MALDGFVLAPNTTFHAVDDFLTHCVGQSEFLQVVLFFLVELNSRRGGHRMGITCADVFDAVVFQGQLRLELLDLTVQNVVLVGDLPNRLVFRSVCVLVR